MWDKSVDTFRTERTPTTVYRPNPTTPIQYSPNPLPLYHMVYMCTYFYPRPYSYYVETFGRKINLLYIRYVNLALHKQRIF